MYKGRDVAVIVAAAGKGERLGGPVPKQYMDMGGEPMLVRTLSRLSEAAEIDHILIVTNAEYVEHCRRITDAHDLDKVSEIVAGGRERQDSVYNAIKAVAERYPDTGYVLVHDGARPFVTGRIVSDVIEAADRCGAAAACVAMKDSLRLADGGESRAVDRSVYYAVQTPQGFRWEVLKDAYEKAYEDGFYGTDDAVLAERAGYDVAIVEGDYSNIKITTREDMPMEYRSGTGFDVHAFAEGRKLILGGVDIPHDKGLDGHSDADVLIHALMDALLGAAALGDIGMHFPDTDERYKGISSMKLLMHVSDMLCEKGYRIVNADVTVMAQEPKIRPYVEDMRENIAKALKLEKSRINIKGTTTERLGFVGRGEGIAAEAVCSVCR